MAFGTTYRRSSITKMLIAEIGKTSYALPKSEEKYEPQTYLSPTGRRIAKVMIAGTVVDAEELDSSSGTPIMRMRVSDPTGTITVMAGQYQPEAAQVIEEIEVPSFVCVVGKLNIYEPEEASKIVSIRPDSVTVIDGPTRDGFILDAALSTIRDIRAEAKDNERVKKVLEEAYPDGDSREAYLVIAHQALESLVLSPKMTSNDNNDKGEEEEADKNKTKAKRDSATPAKKEKQPPIEEASPPSSSSSPEPSPEEIDKVAKGIIKALDSRDGKEAEYDVLPRLLADSGIKTNNRTIDEAIDQLLAEGFCVEPKIGILRYIP